MNLFASQAVPSVPTALWSLPCVLNLAPSQAGFGAAAGCCLLPAINKLPWAAHPEQTLLCQQGLTLCQRSCCCCLDDKAPLFPPVGTPGFLHMQEIGFFPHINAKPYLRTAGWVLPARSFGCLWTGHCYQQSTKELPHPPKPHKGNRAQRVGCDWGVRAVTLHFSLFLNKRMFKPRTLTATSPHMHSTLPCSSGTQHYSAKSRPVMNYW